MIQPACDSYIAWGIHKCAALKGQRKCGHLYSQIWFISQKICQQEFQLTKAVTVCADFRLITVAESSITYITWPILTHSKFYIIGSWNVTDLSNARPVGLTERNFTFEFRLCHAKFIATLPNYCSCLFGAFLAASKSTKIDQTFLLYLQKQGLVKYWLRNVLQWKTWRLTLILLNSRSSMSQEQSRGKQLSSISSRRPFSHSSRLCVCLSFSQVDGEFGEMEQCSLIAE